MKKLKKVFKDSISFVYEAKEELSKIVWPSRDEVTSFTIVVIISVIMVSMFLWSIDTGLVTFIKMVLN